MQPPYFVAQEVFGNLCRLKRSLYGLKQSLGAWFGRFSEMVQKFYMQKSKCGRSVFYRNSNSNLILLVVYIDDIVIIESGSAGSHLLSLFFKRNFKPYIWVC